MAPFTVLPYSKDAFLDSLVHGHVRRAHADKNRRALYLFGYLDHLKALSIVVEENYVDGDYLDDYANYYVKAFDDYSRRCKRLHFFAVALSQQDVEDSLRSRDALDPLLESNYLGFVVVRPLPNAIIGRTVLRTYEADNGRRLYRAVRPYEANLFGSPFRLESLAFQEQDEVLAACATVALWSAFQATSDLFRTAAPTPAQITQAATSAMYSTRPLPSRGLNLWQMTRAVRDVNLEPEVVEYKSQVPFISLLHSYLEFKLPVVLGVTIEGLGGHALTVVGYSLRPGTPSLTHENVVPPGGPAVPRVGLWIDELYVHDDQVGPFARLRVVSHTPTDDDPFAVYFTSEGWVDPASNVPRRLIPEWAMVPVYHKVRLTYLDLQTWLVYASMLASAVSSAFGKNFADVARWTTSLTSTNAFKTEAKTLPITDAALHDLLFKQLPRFLWKATLELDGKPVLVLLFDATGMAGAFPGVRAFSLDDTFHAGLQQVLRLSNVDAAIPDEAFVALMRNTQR